MKKSTKTLPRITLCFLFLIIIQSGLFSQCPPGDVLFFDSQQSINQFALDYPNCTEVEANLEIVDNDNNDPTEMIVDLSPLNSITSIIGRFQLYGCDSLTSLDGLENLTYVADYIGIGPTSELISIEGFQNVENSNRIGIIGNKKLINLVGLESLTPNELFIQNNGSLTTLDGLENLTSISGDLIIDNNVLLNDLSGLENLEELEALIIEESAIVNLIGLESLKFADRISIQDNQQLISFDGLNSIQNISQVVSIRNNISLNDISALYGITMTSPLGVSINDNPMLSACCPILPFLDEPMLNIIISNNASGCQDSTDIAVACENIGPCDYVGMYETAGDLVVNGLQSTPISKLQVLNEDWAIVYSCLGDCEDTEIISGLNGTYYVKASFYSDTWEEICTLSDFQTIFGGPCIDSSGDTDNDGICDEYDICPTIYNPSQDDTDNDGIGDECETTDDPCELLGVSVTNGVVSIEGIEGAPVSKVRIFDENWATLYQCYDDADCTPLGSFILANGLYHIKVGTYDQSWSELCEAIFDVTVIDGASMLVQQEDAIQNLLVFQATSIGRSADLSWVSNSDYEVVNYQIERSVSGEPYEVIATLSSEFQDHTPRTYQVEDNDTQRGIHHYRLKLLLTDGGYRYSTVEDLFFNFNSFHVYPNPVNEQLFVLLKSPVEKEGILSIYDSMGKVMIHKTLSPGIQQLPALDMEEYPGGLYTLRLQVDGARLEFRKIIVVRD